MTRLETLYQSIEGLKKLGLPLNEETLLAVDALEEELIKNEVIPRLSDTIEPIITKIQRPIVLVVDYVPGEDLSVRLTRKRVITEDAATKMFSVVTKENEVESKTQTKRKSHTKQPGKGLMVTFPNGRIISNRFAYETMMEAIEVIGVDKVKALGLKDVGIDLISKEKDDFYNQHQTKDGYFVVTHSSTDRKAKILKEVSDRLELGLEIETVGEDKLIKSLKTFGVTTFIKFYYLFKENCNNDSNEEIFAAFDKAKEKWNINSYNTKASVGKSIFRNNQHIEVLQYIIDNVKRIDEVTLKDAKRIYDSEIFNL